MRLNCTREAKLKPAEAGGVKWGARDNPKSARASKRREIGAYEARHENLARAFFRQMLLKIAVSSCEKHPARWCVSMSTRAAPLAACRLVLRPRAHRRARQGAAHGNIIAAHARSALGAHQKNARLANKMPASASAEMTKSNKENGAPIVAAAGELPAGAAKARPSA